MPIGTVARFNPTRGFGFVTGDEEDQNDIFVHQKDIKDEGFRFLCEGERVEFDIEENDKGLKAVNVKIVDKDHDQRRRMRDNYSRRNDRQDRAYRRSNHGGGRYDAEKLGRMLDQLLEILHNVDLGEGNDEDPILTKDDLLTIYKA